MGFDRESLAKDNNQSALSSLSDWSNLDASLKRNTALVKKLRTISDDSRTSLLNEVKACKLSKYISEVVASLTENRFKQLQDIHVAVEICSVLHQRFPEFTPLLLQAIQKVYAGTPAPDEDEKTANARISRHRAYSRFLIELVLVKIFKEEKMIVHLLRKLLQNDQDFQYLTTAVTILKTYPVELFGLEAQKGEAEQLSTTLIKDETKSAIRQLYLQYYESLSRALVSTFKTVRALDREYTDYSFTKGDLTEKQKERFESVSKRLEKYQSNAQIFCEILDLQLPELKDDDPKKTSSISAISPGNERSSGRQEFDLTDSPFDDEESQQFYQSLTDVSLIVPHAMLNICPQTTVPTNATKPPEEQSDAAKTDNMDDEIAKLEMLPDEPEIDKEEDSNALVGGNADLETFLQKLPTLLNRDLIDQAAIEFCYLNSKSARNKLIKTLASLPRNRTDLIPYYSRLIATLSGKVADIGEEIQMLLLREFKGLRRKKDLKLAETKIRNSRYIGELIKFGVMKTHVAFFCLQALLDDFAGTNVDALCHLLEVCGRYLFKIPETKAKLVSVMEIMMRKKNLPGIDNRQAIMIENAFCMVNPPERVESKKRPKSPVELYLMKLIYVDLGPKTVDQVLKQIRKLPWDVPEVSKSIEKIFVKIWKLKFANVHLIASMLSGLSKYRENFCLQVVDSVIEEIRIGLEGNNFKHNQRRIAVVKYLAELYNYQLIEESLIFDTLYTIVTFGHENGLPVKDRICPIDSPNDFFRVRLVCEMLSSCGQYFDYGSLKKKLNMFLVFLQYYIFTKNPISMDVEFLVLDLFENLRPKMKMLKSLDESILELERIKAEQMRKKSLKMYGGKDNSIAEVSSSSSSSDEDEDDNDDEQEQEQEQEKSDSETSNQEQTLSDEDFDRAFAEMMTESVDSRKTEKKPQFDAAIPFIKSNRSIGSGDGGSNGTSASTASVPFTLLAKKGNKVTTKEVLVPSQSSMVRNVMLNKEEEKKEQMKMKKLVLAYSELQQ